ncbi:hypothetical protein F5Y11DRAFT_51489 [Daldinia sp. FL1419]|nr:hypothetical protein F5Y11DRAFT_51489 [Daldinia sp. FL1419]
MFGKHPESIKELQIALRLRRQVDAEDLLKEDAVKEAFRVFMNRCLIVSGSRAIELPNWKEVDDYLETINLSYVVRRGAKTIDSCLQERCTAQPYSLKPHVAQFYRTLSIYLTSTRGEEYDMPLEPEAPGERPKTQFDRCVRIMNLLGFLVDQSRRAREAEELRKKIGDNAI